jgi:hypothetical protein
VAQYGLYPDWIQDLTKVAGSDGAAIEDDMMRGAEAYLQTWERAEGIAPDPCRNPDLRLRAPAFRRAVTEGMTTRQVMRAVGQPWQRLGQEFTYCATAEGRRAELEVSLSRGGRVTGVLRSA